MASAYRYGNDIRVYWTIIDSEGQPYNLEGRDLRLWMKNGTRKFEVTDYHVAGNIITWVYYGKNQSNCFLGTFEAILCENCGEIGMATLDTQDVFRLVSRSKDSSAGDGVRVRTEAVVNIQSQLTASVQQLCITKEEYEDIFGVGSATHGGSAMETPDVLASLKDYIDKENIEDIYVLDTYPSVGTVYSEDVFDAMATSKVVAISGNDAILGRAVHFDGGSYLSFLKITSGDKSGVVAVATLSHGEDEYTVTALTETVVVDRVYLEQNFLSIADASATYLSKAVAAATYLKITDAAVQYVAKTGGVFTGPVSFSGGISATGASLSGEVNMNNNRIRNVASPVNDADAANKGWVVALIGSIQQFHYEVYPSLSSVADPQGNVLYLIGPTGGGTDKYEEYVYDASKTSPWIKIGDTSIDLSGYMPKSGGTFTGAVTFNAHVSANDELDMGFYKITSLIDPENDTDAANKEYVDHGLATKASASDVSDISAKIPAQASAQNQLADKNFVNSSIQTATATFKGNWETWGAVPFDSASAPSDWGTPDNNDYMVVRDASGYAPKWVHDNPDGYEVGDYVNVFTWNGTSDGLYRCISPTSGWMEPGEDTEHWEEVDENPAYEGTWRFKYVPNGQGYDPYNWLPEYQVNEKPLTAEQLAALNSGIVSNDVTKLRALPTEPVDTQAQVLTDSEKEQARENIGALSAEDLPWSRTIEPDAGNDYIGIFVPEGACTLAVDSVGFHGLLCITNAYGISSATFVGSGGIDTSVNVESGMMSTTPVIVLKSNNNAPITITCVAGNAPDRAIATDEIIITPIATKAWTELGAGGGSDVFVAEYGVTPFADILAAYNAGKIPVCLYDNTLYVLSRVDSNYAYFGGVNQTILYYLRVSSTNAYMKTLFNAEITSNKKSSWSTTPNNTNYPSEKLVKDSIDAVDKVFVAVEGATSVAEILAAVAANKLPVSLHNGAWYVYAYDDNSNIYFTCTIQNLAKYIRVPKNGNVWYYGQIAIENIANKVTTISGNENNTTKYPCTKAVYDFIPTSVADTSAADLEIADENGNVIVSFNEGHIKTRLFDSRDAQEKLVSEENIKSINGSSLLGNGPLKISDTQKISLKILFLGNSFSMDTCSYVPWVMANTNPGVEVKLGCLYIAGASLSDHVRNIQNSSAAYTYYSFFGSGPYDVADDKWSESANASANSILAAETWDYIVLQQKSINSGNYNTIDGTLDTLVGLIREICGDNIKFGWLLTQAYTDTYLSSLGTKPVDADGTSLDTSKKMYEAIASVAHDVCENYGIDFLIPTGTAIQNARLTSLGSLGSSGGLTADGYHLQEGLPCLIGAYSMVMAILRNANFSETTVMLSPFRLDDAWDDAYTPTDQHNGTVVGINDDNCLIAQKCAVRALYSPFEVKRIR